MADPSAPRSAPGIVCLKLVKQPCRRKKARITLYGQGKFDFFKGFIVQAFPADVFGDNPRPEGTWMLRGRSSKTMGCHHNADTVTHTNNQFKANLTMLWQAPVENLKDFRIRATIVKDAKTHWEGIMSPIITVEAHKDIPIPQPNPPPNPNPNTVTYITPSPPPTDNKETEKKALLDQLAKEVGADSASELLELLKAKVQEKDAKDQGIPVVTVPPVQKTDEIKKIANNDPVKEQKVEKMLEDTSLLGKVKGLFGGGGSGILGKVSGLLGGGGGINGIMKFLPIMMGMKNLGGLGGMLGGGGGPMGLLGGLLGGGGGGVVSTRIRIWDLDRTILKTFKDKTIHKIRIIINNSKTSNKIKMVFNQIPTCNRITTLLKGKMVASSQTTI
uniref:Putative defense protein 3 n=1 Tax=Magallana gigas TaxID=29159 RepID=K1RHS1_MAGGI